MSQKVQQFVQSKFNTDLAGELGLEGRQRIHVQFRIDNKGKVVDVRAALHIPGLNRKQLRLYHHCPICNLVSKAKTGRGAVCITHLI